MDYTDHPIEDGEIEVASVINSCFFWVRCSQCPSLRDIDIWLHSYKPVAARKVDHGDKVVVKKLGSSETDPVSWYRAVILKCEKENDMYEVYLPDDMTVWRLNLSSIYIIDNSKWEKISTPHVVGLHGGVPIPANDKYHEQHIRECVADILKPHGDVVIQFSWMNKRKHLSGTFTFGDVQLVTPTKAANFLFRLVGQRLAVRREKDYYEVLEEEGWLKSVVKELKDVSIKLNPQLHSQEKLEKVLKVLPPPKTVVDPVQLAALREISISTKMEDQILPIIKNETHDEYNERMRQSVLINATRKSMALNSETNMGTFNGNHSHAEPLNPLKYCGRGLTFPRVNIDGVSSCSIDDPGAKPESSCRSQPCKEPQSTSIPFQAEPPNYYKGSGRGFLFSSFKRNATYTGIADGLSNHEETTHQFDAPGPGPSPESKTDLTVSDDLRSRQETLVPHSKPAVPTFQNSAFSKQENFLGLGRGKLLKSAATRATPKECLPGSSGTCERDDLPDSRPLPATQQYSGRGPQDHKFGEECTGLVHKVHKGQAEVASNPCLPDGRGVLPKELFSRKGTSDSEPLPAREHPASPALRGPSPKIGKEISSKTTDPSQPQASRVLPEKFFPHSSRSFEKASLPAAKQSTSPAPKNSDHDPKQISALTSSSKVPDTNEPRACVKVLARAANGSDSMSQSGGRNDGNQNGISHDRKCLVGRNIGVSPHQVKLPEHLLSSECSAVGSEALKNLEGLIFGEGSSDVQVAYHIGDLKLHPGISNLAIRAGLKAGLKLTRPQNLAMPAILKRRNVILVGPNRSKKTSAVLLPLMNLLTDTDYYSLMPRGNGPRCVIVAPTSERVKTIGQLCSQYGGNLLKTVISYGGGLEKERVNDLTEGCDVLVTTPRCWLRLMSNAFVTNACRLCHLVLDRFDILNVLFAEEIHRITGIVRSLVSMRTQKGGGWELLGVQTVLMCEKWTPPIQKWTQMLEPLLIFTSFIECAVLCRIKPVLIISSVDCKIGKLKGLLEEYPFSKVAVACSDMDDVMTASGAVSGTRRCPDIVLVHEGMSNMVLDQISSEWTLKKYPVLIFSDRVLTKVTVTDADVLVHFSLPASKSSFGDRFVTIRDALVQRVIFPKDAVQPRVYMLAGAEERTSAVAFPFIVDYLRRFHIAIPPCVEDTLKRVKRCKEETKEAPFCDSILQTGRCFDEDHCKWRHVLRNTDQDNLDFTQGLLRLAVCHIHSAVKFSVRILEHNPHPKGEGPWTKYRTEYSKVMLAMTAHFANHGNRRLHGWARVGDVVAYLEDGAVTFHRARVVDVVEKDHRDNPKLLRIFAMDFGYEVNASDSTLFELPEHLKAYPDQTECLYLANLKPVDLDTSWSVSACTVVENAIEAVETDMQPKDDIIARVLFRFDGKMIVDNLRWVRRKARMSWFALDLRHTILSSNSGLSNPEYSTTMTQLFEEASLDCYVVKNVGVPKIEEKKEPPSWSHLSSDCEYTHVRVFEAESPSRFYVQSYVFQDQLFSLHQEIGVSISERGIPLLNPDVGDFCIARSPRDKAGETTWNRCLIKELNEESATLLFVDYGDLVTSVDVNQLFEIPWKLVTKLPFQAVECSLAGVKPSIANDDDWCEEAVDEFIGLIANDGEFTDLYVKVLGTDKHAERTGGRRYSVVAVNLNDTPFCVNEKLNFGVRTIDDYEVDLVDVAKLCKGDPESSQDQGDAVSDSEEDKDTISPYCQSQENGPPDQGTSLLQMNMDEVELSGVEEWLEFLGLIKKAPQERRMIEDVPANASPDEVSRPAENRFSEPDSGPSAPVAGAEPKLFQLIPHKTPKVCWSQDEDTVTLRFMIPCLRTYKLRITTSSITLIAKVTDDLYHQKVKFFGLVNGIVGEQIAGASDLSIRVLKLVRGLDWPRLTLLDMCDKNIYFDAGDRDLEDPDSMIEQYIKHGEAARKRKRDNPDGSDDEPDVVPDYLVPVPEGVVESDDDLFEQLDYRPFHVGPRDDFGPFSEV